MFGVSGLRIEQLRESGASAIRLAMTYGGWSLVWAAAHSAGGALVGACLGATGALISQWPVNRALWILAALLVGGGFHHLRVVRLPMPQAQRQVPRNWMLSWPLTLTALGYGVQLGAAVSTRITNFSTYVALAAALLSRNASMGALIMAVFGLARAVPAIIVGPFASSPQRSFALAFHFGALEDRVHRASGMVLLLTGLLVATALLFPAIAERRL